MSRGLLCSLLAAVLVASGAATAGGQAIPSPPSLDARDLVASGLAALELREWELALREFKLAQISRPLSPELFLLLGVTCEATGGRDVEAIAWLRAYLALAGQAPRAAEARDRIARLEKRIEALARSLVAEADGLLKTMGVDVEDLTAKSAGALALAGDLEEARRRTQRLRTGDIRVDTQRLIAIFAAERGDVAAAIRLVDDIGTDDARAQALSRIVVTQANRGEFDAARRTARRSRCRPPGHGLRRHRAGSRQPQRWRWIARNDRASSRGGAHP